MSRPDYSLLGRYARADVHWFGTGAVLTGHLAGELVCRVFGGEDCEKTVFAWAKALAFEGRWPRELDLTPVRLPEVACA